MAGSFTYTFVSRRECSEMEDAGGFNQFLLNFVFSEHHICTWISIERKITVTIRICMNKGKSGMIFFVQN